jgi:hypothetical protein
MDKPGDDPQAGDRHADAHAEIERRLDGHSLEIGALKGEQGLVRLRLADGSKSMAAEREIQATRYEAVTLAVRELTPKPWGAWARAVAGAVGFGGILAIVALIRFLSMLPTGEDVKSVRAGVLQDVNTARAAAQAVEVRQAELGGDLKVIQAAQVRSEATIRDVSGKIDELLTRRAP